MSPKYSLSLSAFFSALALPIVAMASDLTLTYKNGNFTPTTIQVPAGEKVKLLVVNADNVPIEFESYELNREKIISANSQAVVFVGPLEAGSYPFFNEFNLAAKGTVQAK